MRTRQDHGFVLLVTVILIGAVILSIGIAAAFLGQTDVILAGQADRDVIARNLAQTCIEEALHRLKLNSGYTGGTVPIGTDSCTATVTGSGSSRTIVAAASTDSTFTKTITVAASLKQNTAANASGWHVDSWSETDPP